MSSARPCGSRSTRSVAATSLLAATAVIAASFVAVVTQAGAAAAASTQWVHQLGSPGFDQAYGVAMDASGDTYVTGYTYGTLPGSAQGNAGAADVFVAKYDPTGSRIWVAQLGSTGYDIANGIAVDAAGDAYVTGYTDGTLPGAAQANAGGTDVFVAKFDPSGNRVWVDQLGSASADTGVGIGVDGSGNAYVTGYTSGTLPGSSEVNAGATDLFVAEYDAAGNQVWVDQLGSSTYDVSVGLAVDGSGDAYVTGYTYGTLPGSAQPNAGGGDVFVAKYDPTGTVLWVDQLGSVGNDNGHGIAVDASGNAYVVGSTSATLPGSVETNAGGGDAFLAKYDATGNKVWVHQLGTALSDLASGVTVDRSGNPFVTGYTSGTLAGSSEPNAGGADVFVARYDTAGTQLSVDQLGTASVDEGTGIAVDGSGDAHVTGYSYGTLPGSAELNAGSSDVFLAELDFNFTATAPGAPTAVTAVGAPASATVSWTAPADNGSAITGYTVTAAPGGAAATVDGALTTATLSGLTNGTSYTFTVTATNAVGTGSPSAPSNAVTPADIAAPPAGVTAVAGDEAAAVSWTASVDNGSPVSGYTVTAAPGGASATVDGALTTATVTGLTNGTAYTFTVTATNAVGTSAPSDPSNAVTPEAVPDAPSGVVAVAGSQLADVSWTAPSDNGSPITSYTVTAAPGGASITVDVSETSATVTGLADGTAYTFTVTATNGFGTSLPSAESNAVTPADAPAAPTGVLATAGDQQASVAWTAAADNGRAVSGYTVLASPGGATVSVAGGVTNATVTGLTNGTAYTFTVTATNDVGPSVPSAPSNAVTPVAPAGVAAAPSLTPGSVGSGQVDLTWAPPAANGSPITGYAITASPGALSVSITAAQASCADGIAQCAWMFTGLTNGVAYTFTATATNGAGTSPASAPTNPVTPVGPPAPPTAVSAVAGKAQATVSWTLGATGGSAITGESVIASPGGITVNLSGAQTSATVVGLTNGVSYTFTVAAANAFGPSSPSTSNAVVPADVPGAPERVTASVSSQRATVRWSAPAANGRAVTGYTVLASPGGKSTNVPPTQTLATIAGLGSGTYTFTVRAQNAIGTGPWSAASGPVTIVAVQSVTRSGYWMLAANGAVYGFGAAAALGNAPGSAVAFANLPNGTGYWVVDAFGDVSHFGAAADHGGNPHLQSGEIVTTISASPSGNGYWLFTSRGRAFAYGDAHFFGDMSGVPLNGPVIASVATPTGRGYYMVASDGGVFSFGDARFHGSTGNMHLNKPIVGISPTPDNRGYWLVASDGGVFAFDAPFRGSMGATTLNKPVNGLVAYGSGYLMVASDGGVFDFSDKAFTGSLGGTPLPAPIIGIAAFTTSQT